MRLAIADPPYLGRASRWYHPDGGGRGYGVGVADHHPEAGDWDDPARHELLVRQLDYGYDGWAVAASPATFALYMQVRPDARVLIWWRENAQPSVTDTRPPRCDYDRTTGHRLTRTHHLDTCPGIGCDGCEPCTPTTASSASPPHRRRPPPRLPHLHRRHPRPTSRRDRNHTGALRGQAITAPATAGNSWPRHPSPAATPWSCSARPVTARPPRTGGTRHPRPPSTKSKSWAHYADDHRPKDLEPPLSLLAQWEDRWRTVPPHVDSGPAIRGGRRGRTSACTSR
jgi:hypothetical protein